MERHIRAGPLFKNPNVPSHFHYYHKKVSTMPQPGLKSFLVLLITLVILPAFFIGIGGLAGSGMFGEKVVTRVSFLTQGFRIIPSEKNINKLLALYFNNERVSS